MDDTNFASNMLSLYGLSQRQVEELSTQLSKLPEGHEQRKNYDCLIGYFRCGGLLQQGTQFLVDGQVIAHVPTTDECRTKAVLIAPKVSYSHPGAIVPILHHALPLRKYDDQAIRDQESGNTVRALLSAQQPLKMRSKLDELPADDPQRKNLERMILYYEAGGLMPYHRSWIVDGRTTTKKPSAMDAMGKAVATAPIFSTHFGKPSPDSTVKLSMALPLPESDDLQLAAGAVFAMHTSQELHEMFAMVRLRNTISRPICIDFVSVQDSEAQVLLPQDLSDLNFDPAIHSLTPLPVRVRQSHPQWGALQIEMQIVSTDGEALTPWYDEVAVVHSPDDTRLSGLGMRNYLYFMTAPGGRELYAAGT